MNANSSSRFAVCPPPERTRSPEATQPAGGSQSGQCWHVDLSVILPVHNEAGNLAELLDRLRTTLDQTSLAYELVFIDDGSRDHTARILAEKADEDSRIKLIVLSRNFGQHIAATAGLDAASGDLVLWMDADLQERPEDIPKLIARQREGFDIVYTTRAQRQQSRLRASLSRSFMKIMNRLAGLYVSPDQAVMRLFTRQVADALRQFPERNRFLGYLMAWSGYRTADIQIEVDARRSGRSAYSMLKLIRHALTGVTSFSTVLLRGSAALAGLALLGCSAGIAWTLLSYFVWGVGVSGWTSLITVLLGLHALQFGVLAVIGEYLGVVCDETRGRPLYLCARTINLDTTRYQGTSQEGGVTNPAQPEKPQAIPASSLS